MDSPFVHSLKIILTPANDIQMIQNMRYVQDNLKSLAKTKSDVKNDVIQYITSLTQFLPTDTPLAIRLWHIISNTAQIPTCNHCSTPVKWNPAAKQYRQFCSMICRGKDESLKQAIANTNYAKYGTKSPTQNPLISHKIAQAWSNKSPADIDNIVMARTQTMRLKYGVDNASQSEEVKQKKRVTSISNYGVEYPSQHSLIKIAVKNTWNTKEQLEINDIVAKRGDTTLLKHGTFNASMATHVKNQKIVTLMANYGVDNPNYIKFPDGALNNLSDKDWMIEQHYNQQKTLTVISEELGVGDATVGRYAKHHGIRTRRFPTSQGEKEISEFLTSHNVTHLTNDRSIISPLELDIYIPEHRLAIEYCGLYWHSEQQGKSRSYHHNKWKGCADRGIQLLTIFADEWDQKSQCIKSKILHLCNKSSSNVVYARQTKIKNLTTSEKREFFEEHHIQGDGPGSISYGLLYQDKLVAAVAFIKTGEEYYLNRYATSVRVVGGFSKLLRHFTINNHWSSIVSFADLRFSDGSLYYSNGWVLDSVLPPDYSYSPDTQHRYHKFNYRRKYLPKLLETFDPALSEWENCKANSVYRIWDCGKLRFKMVNPQV